MFKKIFEKADFQAAQSFIHDVEEELTSFSQSRKGFLSQLTQYTLIGSGKRVRPGLVYLCAQFGDPSTILMKEMGLAVELIHIATLVHDDLVDHAVLRRKKETVSVRFGNDAAVLLGDYIYAKAFQKLACVKDTYLMELFSDTTMVMCEGEIGQLEHRYDFDVTEDQYLSFLDRKTASLMSASCRAGGRLGGIPLKQQEALADFGRLLGLAFQIMDDILDLEGDESLTGKTLRTDLMNGKMTLPLIHFFQKIKNESDRQKFMECVKNPEDSMTDFIQKIRNSGSISYGREKVRELGQQAEDVLKTLPDHPSRRLLSSISQRLAVRED